MPARPLTALARLDEAGRAEYWAALALRRSRGLGARTIRRLLHHFGSAYQALQNLSRWQEAGVPAAKSDVLHSDDWRVLARPEWEDSRDLDGHIVLWTDPRYPAPLRELPDAPALLYCRGDLSLLAQPCVAVVGSRACSARSVRLAGTIARGLSASGITVVSGMARGIDHAAHVGALHEQGRTIAVLGAGLDIIYPPQHSDLYRELGAYGLLISEFPPGTRPEGSHFPIRNRIISGLSLGVLVVEAAPRSGSLITARLALEQNRAVYAVPPPGWVEQPTDRAGQADAAIPPAGVAEGGPTQASPPRTEDGCSSLLDQGARPVMAAPDILADLFPQLQDRLTSCPVAGKEQTPAPRETSARPAGQTGSRRDEPTPKRGSALPDRAGLPLHPLRPGPSPLAASAPVRQAPPPEPEAHTPEAAVLALLRRHGPMHPDELLTRLPPEHADAGRLSGWLILLEMRGLARRCAGSVYEATA